jgi:outer membrane protein assembly factor BamB
VLAVGWVATPAPGGVLSLDPATGATRWSAESLPYATVPAVVGERVVVAQCTDASAADGEVVGLDARTGARRWTAVTGGIFHPLTWIAVDGDEVYVPDRVVALDAATGQRGWVSPRYVQSFRVTRPVIDRDVVMVPAGEGVLPVVALADGRLRARRLAYGDVIGVASAPGDRIVLAVRGPKPHVLAFDRRRFEALAAGRPR